VTADIKTIAAHGCYGVSCVTALTVQSTTGVARVEAVNPNIVSESLEQLSADIDIAAVHVGMLGSGKVVRALADFLAKNALPNVVLDPIIKSSSGADLIDAPGLRLLIERLLPLACVITPNLHEAAALTGLAVTNLDQMRLAASSLHKMGAAGVVVTGGHLDGSDRYFDGEVLEEIEGPQHESGASHGSGCTHSSALAARLALGDTPLEAARAARQIAAEAVANGLREIGSGAGPVDVLGIIET